MNFIGGLKNLKSNEDTQSKFENLIKNGLIRERYMVCIEKCYEDFYHALEEEEKICLAKCLDTLHDHYETYRQDINPILESTEKL